MEWMDQLQLAECGYYPTATNMESNIDKWLMPDSHFKYLTDSSFTYLGRSSDSSIPTITPELAAKLMEFLMSAIKGMSKRSSSSAPLQFALVASHFCDDTCHFLLTMPLTSI